MNRGSRCRGFLLNLSDMSDMSDKSDKIENFLLILNKLGCTLEIKMKFFLLFILNFSRFALILQHGRTQETHGNH